MSVELQFPSSDSRQPSSKLSVAELSLATAHWCAQRGWPVHPLSPGRKTPAANCRDFHTKHHPPTTCPCLPAGRWRHGFCAATLDQDRIDQWWGKHPEFGSGVSCGPAGLIAIDIDAHHTEPPTRDRILPGIPIADHVDLSGLANGFHTLDVLAALHGQRSPADGENTLRVRTPSGELHVRHRADRHRCQSSVGSSAGRALAWQVDIRAHGSYIVAPGTFTRQGMYTPVGDARTPAALPFWLAQELGRTGHLPATRIPAPRSVPPRARQAVLAAGDGHIGPPRVMTTVLARVEACGQIPEGVGFSDTLNRAAYSIGGLIAADRLLEYAAERALREAAIRACPGQVRRIEQIIRSGLAASMKKPLYGKGARL